MPRDDSVAGHGLIRHPEIETAVRDELVDLFEGAGVEQQLDALARGQLPRFALAAQTFFTAAQLGAPIEIGEDVVHQIAQTLAPWAFSQSFRKRSSPMSVSGCLKHDSMTAGGAVTTSAPMRAASIT